MMLRLFVMTVVALALSGCATKPLQAPCSRDEGGKPLAYAPSSSPAVPEPFRSLDACGPMRRI